MGLYEQYQKEISGTATAEPTPPEGIFKRAARFVLPEFIEKRVFKPEPQEKHYSSLYEQYKAETSPEKPAIPPAEEEPEVFKKEKPKVDISQFAGEQLRTTKKEEPQTTTQFATNRLTEAQNLIRQKEVELAEAQKTEPRFRQFGVPVSLKEREAGMQKSRTIMADLKTLKKTEEAFREFLAPKKERGFFSSFFNRIKETMDNPDEWLERIPYVMEYAKTRRAIEAVSGKETAVRRLEAEQILGTKPTTRGEQVADVVLNLPTFAIEFALTSGVFVAAKKATEKVLIKTVLPKVVKKVVPQIIGAAVQAETVFIPQIGQRTAEYMLPNANIVAGPDGDQLLDSIKGDSFEKALVKAMGTTFVDILTERMGVLVEKPLSKILPKAMLSKYLAKHGIKGSKALEFIKGKIAWNGIIGEVFEEELAELAQAPIEGRKYYGIWTPQGQERLIVETLGIGFFGGIGKITDQVLQNIYQSGTRVREIIPPEEPPPPGGPPVSEIPPEEPPQGAFQPVEVEEKVKVKAPEGVAQEEKPTIPAVTVTPLVLDFLNERVNAIEDTAQAVQLTPSAELRESLKTTQEEIEKAIESAQPSEKDFLKSMDERLRIIQQRFLELPEQKIPEVKAETKPKEEAPKLPKGSQMISVSVFMPKEITIKGVTRVETQNEFQTIPAKPIQIMPGITTFVGKGVNENKDKYVVYEARTGRPISFGKTSFQAVEEAKRLLENKGIEEIKKVIEEKIKEFGEAPLPEKEKGAKIEEEAKPSEAEEEPSEKEEEKNGKPTTKDKDRERGDKRGELPEPTPDGEERAGEVGEVDREGEERRHPGRISPRATGRGYVPSLKLNQDIEALVAEKGDNPANYSPEELEMLAQYTGSGGRAREGADGRGLLDEYYTPPDVVRFVWQEVGKFLNLNKSDFTILEPSVGTGRFLYYAPKNVQDLAMITGYEINETSATIARVLNHYAEINNIPFEEVFITKNGQKRKFLAKYDLVIGNPPYGEHRGLYLGLGEEPNIKKYEEYFLKRALDVTKEGGIVAMVVPSGFLRSEHHLPKTRISETGKLISAFRFPNKLFDTTDIGTDLVIFKREDGKPDDRNDDIENDNYFKQHPENILGKQVEVKGKFGMAQGVEGSIENVRAKLTEIEAEKVKKVERPVQEKKPSPEAEKVAKQVVVQPKVTHISTKKGETMEVTPLNQFDKKEIELWKYVKATGELSEGFESVFESEMEKVNMANFYKGYWYNNFNYLQGDIYEKFKTLESDKDAISEAQYDNQRKALNLIKPLPLATEQIRLSPQDTILQDIKIDGESLDASFVKFMEKLPQDAFGDSSRWEVESYIQRESIRGSDKERNAEIRKRRREVGNELFNRYLREVLTSEQKKEFERQYNTKRNSVHKPTYKNVPIVTPVHSTFNKKPLLLWEAQKTGAGFLVNKGVGGLAYEVGVGKTLTSLIAVNEMIAKGWAKRPLIVVEKNNYRKWLREIEDALPGVTINKLENLGSRFEGELATLEIQDGSFSVMTTEGFQRLGFSDETYGEITRDLKDIITDINSSDSKRQVAKQFEKLKEKQGKARQMISGERSFEELGFDLLVLDEAHIYKNLIAGAKIEKGEGNEYTNVRGAQSSRRAIKAFFATQYILRKNNGRNVIMLTATPFTNSPMEYYGMLSFMARERLKKLGMTNVNEFMTAFMDLSTTFKVKANQEIKEEDVIERFRNRKELKKLVDEYFIFDEGAGLKPDKVPKQFFVNPTQEQLDYMHSAESILEDKEKGAPVLRYINELMNITVSPYLSQFYTGEIPDAVTMVENSPKIKLLMEILKQLKIDNPEGSRILHIPRGIELHEKIREYLIKKVGYKPEEVAILSGAIKHSEEKIDDIKTDFNDGKIKILIGSDVIQRGIDLQRNTTHIFRLSLPYRPDEITQIEGRAWRPGNQWKRVMSGLIMMNDSIDPFLNQTLETKDKRTRELQKTSEDTIEVGGEVDFEKLKIDLITDPVKKLRAEHTFELAKEKKKLNALNADLGFVSHKFKEYTEQLEVVKDRKEELKDDKERVAEAIANQEAPFELERYKRWVTNDEESVARAEKELAEIKEKLQRTGGFEIAEEKIKTIQEQVVKQEKLIEVVQEKQEKIVEAARAKKIVLPTAKEQDFSKHIEEIKEIDKTFFEKVEEVRKRAPSGGMAAGGAPMIGTFEKLPERQEKTEAFKLFQKTEELIKKYAVRAGEGYLPRGAAGVYYPDTENIRTSGMNDLSVIVHEVTHRLDAINLVKEKFINETSHAHRHRKLLTNLYEEFYHGAKRQHPLQKRVGEGYATLVQKYIEQPSTITQRYPLLVREFLMPNGLYYTPIITELIKDTREIISNYQALPALDKIGARVTSDNPNIDKESFMSLPDKIRTFVSDNIYPLEVLAKKADVHFTKADPSLWVRMYNVANSIIANNINGNRGYWQFRYGQFIKTFDYNWKTLIERLAESQTSDSFAYYLVARRQFFDYKRVDELKETMIALEKAIDDMGELINLPEGKTLLKKYKKTKQAHDHLKSVLSKDGFTRNEVTEAYESAKDLFRTEEEMFDDLVQADLEFLNDDAVQLLNDERFKELAEEPGYASFKRQFFDEIVGEEVEGIQVARVGKVKISSLISRTGSSRTIVNPVFNALTNHSEITKKGLRQIVYNKIGALAPKFPELFQKQQLKIAVRDDGVFLYPQEKDPQIIMARQNYVRTPFLTDDLIKKTVDGVLTFQNIGLFEKLLMGSSRFFTKGTTGLYPGFTIVNFGIDQVTAAAQTRNNYIPIYSALKELVKIWHSGSSEAKFFEEYLVLGGEKQTFVGWQDLSANELFERIGKEQKGIEKVMELANRGVDILALPAKYSEIITRGSEYIKARQAGKPQIVALEEAGRVTAPFHHIGTLGGRGGQVFVKSIPFFNPAIQVLDQALRKVQKDDGSRMRYVAVTMAVTAASVSSYVLILAAGSDDQRDQLLDLPPDLLDKYLWFPNLLNNRELVKFRVPDQMQVVSSIINMAIAEMIGATNYTFGDYVSAGTAWLPSQFDPTEPTKAIFAWLPQIIKPAIQVATNTKDFPTVRPLESQRQQRKLPEERFTEATPELTKFLGKQFGISPIKIDFLITGYLGRVTKFATEKPTPTKLARKLFPVTQQYYFASGRRVQRYFDLKEENDQQYKSMKDNPKQYSAKEERAIKNQRNKLKEVDKKLDDFDEIDIEKYPAKASLKRQQILKLIEKL